MSWANKSNKILLVILITRKTEYWVLNFNFWLVLCYAMNKRSIYYLAAFCDKPPVFHYWKQNKLDCIFFYVNWYMFEQFFRAQNFKIVLTIIEFILDLSNDFRSLENGCWKLIRRIFVSSAWRINARINEILKMWSFIVYRYFEISTWNCNLQSQFVPKVNFNKN